MKVPSHCDSCGVRMRGEFVQVVKGYPPFKSICPTCAQMRHWIGLIKLRWYKKNEKGFHVLVEEEDLSQNFFLDDGGSAA